MRIACLTVLALLTPAVTFAQQQQGAPPSARLGEWQGKQAAFAQEDEPRRIKRLEKLNKEVDAIERREISTWNYLRSLPQQYRSGMPVNTSGYSAMADIRRRSLARHDSSAMVLNQLRRSAGPAEILEAIDTRITVLDILLADVLKRAEVLRELIDAETKLKMSTERMTIGERPDPNWKTVAEYWSRRVRVSKDILDFEKSRAEEWNNELIALRLQKEAYPKP